MRTFVIVSAAFLLTALGSAADMEDGWRNLKRVTRDRLYAVVLRDHDCVRGSLVSADDKAVVIGDSGTDRRILRSDVLRVSDDSLHAETRDTVFNGRSSWIDVKDAGPRGTEYLHIFTKHGEEWKWQKPTVSDDSVTSEGKRVAKIDVRYISYFRSKPLTRGEEYVSHENADWLAPRLWFNGLMLGKISVLLYNSELAEDNSPVRCR